MTRKSLFHAGRQPRRPAGGPLPLIFLVWLALAMAVALPPTLAAGGRQEWTPPVGSSERTSIVNALRQEVKDLHRLDVRFVITFLKVKDNWAWVQTRPQSPGGENRYEDIAALLTKMNGAWRVRELACTEPDNPDCLGEADFFRRLRNRFPEAPPEIFPPF
jgi:hypothetical protein